jgi:hypothetical protein
MPHDRLRFEWIPPPRAVRLPRRCMRQERQPMKKRRAPNAQPLYVTSDIGRTRASEPEASYSHGGEMATPSPQPIPAKKKVARIPRRGTRATRALVTRSRGIYFLVLLPLATA